MPLGNGQQRGCQRGCLQLVLRHVYVAGLHQFSILGHARQELSRRTNTNTQKNTDCSLASSDIFSCFNIVQPTGEGEGRCEGAV